MSDHNFGPYRATALWNEAVQIFRDGMSLGVHRHRLHKHKDSFTGRHAVSFIHEALKKNRYFSPDVTREQACQLLNQFINAKLIRPVSNCSAPKPKNLVDSYNYLYEFTESLRKFQSRLPFTGINVPSVQPRNKKIEEVKNGCVKYTCKEDIWKEVIMTRIANLLEDVNVWGIMPVDNVKSDWVFINANSDTNDLKWKTGLPDWVIGAMNNFLNWSDEESHWGTYHNFEIDVFNVIHEYFSSLKAPLISYPLYDLFLQVFLYLDYKNALFKEQAVRAEMTASREHLVMKISSPLKFPKNSRSLKRNEFYYSAEVLLPPDSCLETAFTSDNPVTRIVPKCSVDTIHLQTCTNSGNASGNLKETASIIPFHYAKSNANSLPKDPHHVCSIYQHPLVEKENISYHTQIQTAKNPGRGRENIKRYRTDGIRFTENSGGVVNHAFRKHSPSRKITVHLPVVPPNDIPLCPPTTINVDNELCNGLRALRVRPLPKPRIVMPKRKQWTKSKRNKKMLAKEGSGFCNPALSFSSDDLDAIENGQGLDFSSAMESLQKLMRVSVNKKQENISSDDESSYYTATSSSSRTSSSDTLGDPNFDTGVNCIYEWGSTFVDLGIKVYHLLIMLLPPCNRAQLRGLIHLMLVFPSARLSYLSQASMISRLGKSIMRPKNEVEFDPFLTKRILLFFLSHYDSLFTDLSPSDSETINLYVSKWFKEEEINKPRPPQLERPVEVEANDETKKHQKRLKMLERARLGGKKDGKEGLFRSFGKLPLTLRH